MLVNLNILIKDLSKHIQRKEINMYYRSRENKSGAYAGLICGRVPFAKADIKGSAEYPAINGIVNFFSTPVGIVVNAEIFNLPYNKENGRSQIYGFHIHNIGRCTGSGDEPFSDAGSHFDNRGSEHPYHSGDLPPLFGNGGYAWSATLTDRFAPEDILGRSIIIHMERDDLKTDPSGNSGRRIACGVIV